MLNIQINEFSQSECTHAANLQVRKWNAASSWETSSPSSQSLAAFFPNRSPDFQHD